MLISLFEVFKVKIRFDYWFFFSPTVGPGFYPPLMHQISVPKDPEQWAVESSYSIVHNVEAMAKIKGIGRGKKHNLMAQVIPIYGFGILLYILYIIYKVIMTDVCVVITLVIYVATLVTVIMFTFTADM